MKKFVYSILSPICQQILAHRGSSIGLCYHRFTTSQTEDPVPGMAIDPQEFRMHLEVLKSMGALVSVDAVLQSPITSGLRFFVTFDDGYQDNLIELLPIIEEYNCPVCIYVVGGIAKGEIQQLPHDHEAEFHPPLLSPEEIKILGEHPLVTIGSHTEHHPKLARLKKVDVQHEIETGVRSVSGVLGEVPQHFAVPYGGKLDADWTEVMNIAFRAELRSVVSNYGGENPGNRAGNDSPYLLKRVSMGPISDPWNVRGWILTQALFCG